MKFKQILNEDKQILKEKRENSELTSSINLKKFDPVQFDIKGNFSYKFDPKVELYLRDNKEEKNRIYDIIDNINSKINSDLRKLKSSIKKHIDLLQDIDNDILRKIK